MEKGNGNPKPTSSSRQTTIPNTLDGVQVAIQAFEAFAEEQEISMPIMMKINIVFDEILSNVVKYSHQDGQEHPIEVTTNLAERTLTITVQDDGQPFNPFQVSPPDFSVPLEDRQIGGMGIHLVRQLMDGHSYERQGDKNVVTLIKKEV